VNDLTEQSNLLAVNAAIEEARPVSRARVFSSGAGGEKSPWSSRGRATAQAHHPVRHPESDQRGGAGDRAGSQGGGSRHEAIHGDGRVDPVPG
jgi:hypothetical protein